MGEKLWLREVSKKKDLVVNVNKNEELGWNIFFDEVTFYNFFLNLG